MPVAPNEYPSVLVAVLNFNTRHFLEKFVPAILRSEYSNYELLIIDNASTDDSLSWLAQHYPELRTKALSANFGFAGGYNEGLKDEQADYFVLLNSDVEVPPNWIGPVIDGMKRNPNCMAAQPKLRSYKEGHLFEYAGACGGFIDSLAYPFCRGRIFDVVEKDYGQYDQEREVFWASGAAMFVKREAWEMLGGLDADFFAHMEEIDFCWRLKNRGYQVIVFPQSVVYHVGGGTLTRENPRKTTLNFRNTLITMFKNMGALELCWKIPLKLVLDGVAGLRFFAIGQWSNTLAIVKAHFQFHGQLAYWIKKRKESRVNLNINSSGRMKGSVVWAYFISKKTRFEQLDAKIRE